MALSYSPIASRVDAALKKVGIQAKVTRQGAAVGSGYGVFQTSKSSLDAQPMLQTVVSSRTFILSGMAKAPEVGDTLTADKSTYTVTSVVTKRPTNVTLVYVLELS